MGFLSKSIIFCEKISEWAISSKKRAIRSKKRGICSFLVSDLSDLLTSLIFSERPKKREWMNSLFLFKKRTKIVPKNTILVKFVWANCLFFVIKAANEQFTQKKVKWAICSFPHLSWATWVNRSRSLICHEQPEQFAQGRSFDMSSLSDSLTVSHLSWVIWANHSQSGLGTLFFSVRCVTFFSVLKKECSVLFHYFLEFLATYETQKNVPFFSKERKRTQRTFPSF